MALDRRVIAVMVLLLGAAAYYTYQTQEPEPVSDYTYMVVNKYPHDPEAFTQGLIYHKGVFYEGTGLYEQSTLRIVEITSGEPTQVVELEDEYFGEGITILDDLVYQVTWRNNLGLIYDLGLTRVGNFTIDGEGWGLTNDGEYLILSDGTSTISYIDPETHTVSDTITVTNNGTKIDNINELEYIDEMIYANIWQTDMIAVINPETGAITSWINLSTLKNELDTMDDINVLNGIAYNPENNNLYVTGKLWPNLFEIKLVPK